MYFNKVMRTMDLHIIEFFYQLVRQFIRKARRKQNIEDVLFSALHFVTRIVVFRLETGKLCYLVKVCVKKMGSHRDSVTSLVSCNRI